MKSLKEIADEIGKQADGAQVVEGCIVFYNQGGYDSILLTFEDIMALANALQIEDKVTRADGL